MMTLGGKFHQCYISSSEFGAKSGWNAGIIFALVFVTLHMAIMLSAVAASMFTFGSKVNGDKERIFICDQADILSETDEEEVLELLEEVYDASGMPVTIQLNASPMLPLINF